VVAAAGFLVVLAVVGRGDDDGRPPVLVATEPAISPAAIRALAARADRCRSSFDASIHDPFCVQLARGPGLLDALPDQARRRARLLRRAGGS
jgi:hypothetical protein